MNEPIPLTTRYVNFTPREMDIVLRNAQAHQYSNNKEAFSGSVRQIIREWSLMSYMYRNLPPEKRLNIPDTHEYIPFDVYPQDVELEKSDLKIEFQTNEIFQSSPADFDAPLRTN